MTMKNQQSSTVTLPMIEVEKDFELKLKMLGTGNSFSTSEHKGHSRGVIRADETLILIDAGEGTTSYLKGYDFTGIEHVMFCVTHLHPDHAQELLSSIFELLFNSSVEITVFSDMDIIGTGDDGIVGYLKLQGFNEEFVKQYPEEKKRIKFLSARSLFPVEQYELTDAVYVSSFRQDHGIIDACGFVFIHFDTKTKMYDVIVYSGDTNNTARLKMRLNDIYKLKPNIRNLTIFHEASVSDEYSKVHTNINDVVDLAFSLEFDNHSDLNYCMYLYHLPDTITKTSEIRDYLGCKQEYKFDSMDMHKFKIAKKYTDIKYNIII